MWNDVFAAVLVCLCPDDLYVSYALRGTFRALMRFTHVDHMLCVCVLSCSPSTIRISRKGWHMLLNFCFHSALTFAVFAGGINRIKHPIICQAVSLVPFHLSLMCSGVYRARCVCVCVFMFFMHSASDRNENMLYT